MRLCASGLDVDLVGMAAGARGHEILRRPQRGALDQFADDAVHLRLQLVFCHHGQQFVEMLPLHGVEFGALARASASSLSAVRKRAFAAVDDVEARIGHVVGVGP